MFTLRPASERGRSQLTWLDSRHSFSFDSYYDPKHMSFGPLRVINEDWIAGGGGFGTHPHRDMEIITYVIEGELQHKDSLGNGSVIVPGEIQKMTAGSGIRHSEFNASPDTPVHLLQIWIQPDKLNLPPSYEQKKFELHPGELQLLGSADNQGLVSIRQNLKLFGLKLDAGTTATHVPTKGSSAWVQVVKGSCDVNRSPLNKGDGAGLEKIDKIEIGADATTELLLFEFLN